MSDWTEYSVERKTCNLRWIMYSGSDNRHLQQEIEVIERAGQDTKLRYEWRDIETVVE